MAVSHESNHERGFRRLQLVAHGEPSDVIELNTVPEPALGQENVPAGLQQGRGLSAPRLAASNVDQDCLGVVIGERSL